MTITGFDSERMLLSAVLQRRLDVSAVFTLDAEHFTDPLHRRCFSRMKDLHSKNEPINLVLLTETMNLDGVETARVADLLDPLLLATHQEEIPPLVRNVKRGATWRRLQKVCGRISELNGKPSTLDWLRLWDTARDYREIDCEAEQTVELFDTWEEFETSPDISFAAKGFLQNEAVTALAALSGHSKTWTVLALIRMLLFGPGKLWGLFEVPNRAEKVIYLIPESSRTAIKHRLKLMGLYDEIHTGRLRMRTLSKGPTVPLADAALLREVKGAHIVADTAIRFMHGMDDNSAAEVAEGLSEDFFGMLRAGAQTVIPLFHSPKSFLKETVMTLEGMIRGSAEFGAVLATAWGIKQIDEPRNIIHVQCLKARDFEHCGPFQLIGRPYIADTQDFALHKKPEECGSLADEQPDLNRGGGAPKAQRDAKAANLALMREWLKVEPGLTSKEIADKFQAEGIPITDSAVRKYRKNLNKQRDA